MVEIERLPGRGCRFYASGRCLYEEALNPGYNREFGCAILAFLEGKYDDFLDRAEAFRLDMRTAESVWNDRFARLAAQGRECPFEHIRSGGPFYDCSSYFDGLCLSAFPLCEGRCKRYRRIETQGNAP